MLDEVSQGNGEKFAIFGVQKYVFIFVFQSMNISFYELEK